MPVYGEVIYNPTEVMIAKLKNDNTYEAPVAVEYLGKLSFEVEADTDELMSGGMIVETLAIPKKNTGEMTMGKLNMAAMAAMCNYPTGEYYSTPNRVSVLDMLMGGEGLPFFGMIVAYASTLGANLMVGFPKAKLQTVPGFDVDQNKFRIGSANFDAIAPSTTVRKAARFKLNETAATIASFYGASAGNFLSYFKAPTDMFS